MSIRSFVPLYAIFNLLVVMVVKVCNILIAEKSDFLSHSANDLTIIST